MPIYYGTNVRYFDNAYETRDETFANGREVRNFFERMVACQADRLAKDGDINEAKLQKSPSPTCAWGRCVERWSCGQGLHAAAMRAG